jgi:hypothetical protein
MRTLWHTKCGVLLPEYSHHLRKKSKLKAILLLKKSKSINVILNSAAMFACSLENKGHGLLLHKFISSMTLASTIQSAIHKGAF